MTKLKRTYSEMVKMDNFGDRLVYLQLWKEKHIAPRSLDYNFYHNPTWLECRQAIIRRDMGSDLGVMGVDIDGRISVHHINPLEPDDLENWNEDKLFNPENLITVSDNTHNAIHYKPIENDYVERKPGDTILW